MGGAHPSRSGSLDHPPSRAGFGGAGHGSYHPYGAPPILDDERYAALVPLLVNMVLRTHQEVHL